MSKTMKELILAYREKQVRTLCLSRQACDTAEFSLTSAELTGNGGTLRLVDVDTDTDTARFAALELPERQLRGKSYPVFHSESEACAPRRATLSLKAGNGEKQVLILCHKSEPDEELHLTLRAEAGADWQIVYLQESEVGAAVFFRHELAEGATLSFTPVLLTESLTTRTWSQKEGPDRAGFRLYSIAELQRDASYRLHQVSLGGIAGGKALAELCAEGAEAYLDTACFVEDGCVQSYELETRHHAPRTVSDIRSYGVVGAEARGELLGRGDIDKGAFGSHCEQDSRLLSLDGSSEALCYPLLLINEYDVIAGHSSGVGQLDEDVLFYLRSRGLTERESKRLMIAAFLKPNIEKIEEPLIREELLSRLTAKAELR